MAPAPVASVPEAPPDPDRVNPAMTPAHEETLNKVKRLHTYAQGMVDIGDYKAADAYYNQILLLDPYNTAARRGQENANRHISNYLRAARDESRQRMINEVDRQWETTVPGVYSAPAGPGQGLADLNAGGETGAARKIQELIIPRLAFSETPLQEALPYLARKSVEVDTAEPDPLRKGVNIVLDPSGKAPGDFKTITLDLRNVRISDALNTIASQTDTHYQVDGNIVLVAPLGAVGERILTRRFTVPPGILTTAGASGEAAVNEATDPFGGDSAGMDRTSGLAMRRITPKDFLERNGVAFPPGTSADLATAGTMIVRNTERNLEMVQQILEGLSSGGQQQVMVQVKMLQTEQRNLEESGYDWLVGAANVGSSGVFASGGTVGNALASGVGDVASYSPDFVSPFTGIPVGANPVTAGLRGSFDLQANPTISDLIAMGSAGTAVSGARAPGIISAAYVFGDPQIHGIMRGLNQRKGVDLSVATTIILKAGQRAAASSLRNIFFPTEFDPPQIPQTFETSSAVFVDPGGGVLAGTSSSGTPPVTPTTPQSFEERETGSSIEVEATVGEDGHTINLNLIANFREFQGFINYGTPITSGNVVLTENLIFQPVFANTNIVTPSLQIYDGATVTLGGLSSGKYETINDKVPLLGDIPFFGRFFRSNVSQVTRQAVVYFVTVKVVDPAGQSVRGGAVIPAVTGTGALGAGR